MKGVLSAHTHSSVREHLVKILRQDLVGPRTDDEVFPELPTVRYLTGILYPAGTPTDEVEDEEFRAAEDFGEESEAEEANPTRQALRQSSIGLTFEVVGKMIQISVSYARYEKCLENNGEMWRRVHRKPDPISVDLVDLAAKEEPQTIPLDPNGAELEVHVRAIRDVRIVTVFLVNRAEPSDPVRNEDCIFQPEIRVSGHIVARGTYQLEHNNDPDLLSLQLLYRNQPEFAVGHGCAADWNAVGPNHATDIWTVFVPSVSLPQAVHYERDDLDGLDMMVLASCATGELAAQKLRPIVREYREWIESLAKEASSLQSPLRETAARHLAACEEAASRIEDGLDLIASDQLAFEAFRFMNEVMAHQRARTDYVKSYHKAGRRPKKGIRPSGRWYPFQIAFILMNLRSIVDPKSRDRMFADLLWFPTGGGKTEAYLGLAAFTLGYRRLRGRNRFRDHAGVTVLMRYTLRLLTVQQYQRAATMICACEYLRRRNPAKWGTEPFLIGLWVGRNSTPNNNREAEENLKILRDGGQVKEANPVQLRNCPWCGEQLGPHDYHVDERRDWMLIHCPNPECDFHGPPDDADSAIPALTVDDDIYHRCPSLLIGTVDKFARLPWTGRTAALFGLVDRWCPRHGFLTPAEEHNVSHHANQGLPATAVERCPRLRPPELIIQDELHLISGPIGTMVGHFETAVDYLCSLNGGHIPKVVASTATIRRADEQIRQLFNRELRQFPPPGLNADDSFFSRQVITADKPGRQYVGVCATGKSGKTVMVRVFAALLQAVEELRAQGVPPEVLDPYWTLTSYFNSLKELGAAVRLIEDDVPERLAVVASSPDRIRKLDNIQELNSRRDATEIPEILARLDNDLPSGKAIDILLATNMISVGVDISRLGLMVVQGQPKSTSEYIQATSRVGRKYPGLVVTMYNWARPRDLSHYERFRNYHETIYRYVEPTSVTPFSPRARDRALAAILVGMVRLADPRMARPSDAGKFRPDSQILQDIIEAIHRRVAALAPDESDALQEELATLIDQWHQKAIQRGQDLKYNRGYFESVAKAPHVLIRRVDEDYDEAWLVPDSLRDVEEYVRLYYALPKGGTTA